MAQYVEPADTDRPASLRAMPRIAMVLTRDIDEPLSRLNTIRQIRDALGCRFEVDIYRFPSILEDAALRDYVTAALQLILFLIKLRPLPLQCAIYPISGLRWASARGVISTKYNYIYLDTIRCYLLFRFLRKSLPNAKIIFDFDDLMSRRAKQLIKDQRLFGLGYLSDRAGALLRGFVQRGWLGRLITWYESWSLPGIEKAAATGSDGVVLVSEKESAILRGSLGQERARILALIPPPPVIRTPEVVKSPFRFVFIGSDRQIQNREAIKFLLAQWKELSPSTPLHIYGHQTLQWEPSRNVVWHGFVKKLLDCYDQHSLVLAPAFVAGGVKTKILEAWGYGRPALGTPLSFEGIDLEQYPLIRAEDDWGPLLTAPESYLEAFAQAQALGHTFVRKHDKTAYARRWLALLEDDAT